MRTLGDICMNPASSASESFIALMARIQAFAMAQHMESIVRAIECSEVER